MDALSRLLVEQPLHIPAVASMLLVLWVMALEGDSRLFGTLTFCACPLWAG